VWKDPHRGCERESDHVRGEEERRASPPSGWREKKNKHGTKEKYETTSGGEKPVGLTTRGSKPGRATEVEKVKV